MKNHAQNKDDMYRCNGFDVVNFLLKKVGESLRDCGVGSFTTFR